MANKFIYKVHSTDPVTGKHYISNVGSGFNVANFVARKAISDGKVDVSIEVTQENSDDKTDDPSWPAIENAAKMAA